ncbi:MAG: phytoene dehydrogenase [Flavobacteriales bacterium]|nr:phytoene dehydrogenase [Flavobacteriales bacterium]|tara:strand:+ start:5426 stop:6901 length:1476 start_codon:yes stop_codon:yes gene_type:complete
MKKKDVAIIGAGIAGIASAIRLRMLGHQVRVFESNKYPGGKLTAFEENGYRFDMGPSLFTMPQMIEELFELTKKPIDKYFSYQKKENICSYFFEDGTFFLAPGDKEKFIKKATQTFDVSENKLRNYLARSKKKYDLTASLFLEKSLHKKETYLTLDTLKALINISKLDIKDSLSSLNEKTFKDQRLVQFYNRFATYNGSSPYKTPGIMSMIPHLEQYYGTYFPKGGMHQITLSLFALAKDIGVEFNFSSPVSKIETQENKITGIRVNQKLISADIVVSNADVVPTYRRLLTNHPAPEKILSQERSSSALIFYWGVQKEFLKMDLHNIFFSKDYKEEFDYIFSKNLIHEDPTIYINISSKEESGDAPKGCENWFTMINVPNNSGQDWDSMIDKARKNILKKLSRLLDHDIAELIEYESIIDPRDIESRTQSFQGALYGAASNNKFSAFLRHPNFKNSIKNLYFCGGSVHPGGGIPLCLLSGKIVAELIKKNS